MGKIINSTFVSLDGVINHMDRWHFEFVDEESNQIALEQLQAARGLLMGRKTFDVYASAWPGRDGDYAASINRMPKYVVSRTLTDPPWENATVIAGELTSEVARLKETPGDILMHGYGPVAKELLKHGLLDQLHLWVHPMLAGAGDLGDMVYAAGLNARLALIDVSRLNSGVVILSYETNQ